MWVVALEDYDQTVVDFALLAEHSRLEQVAETDRLYALAKLIGVAFLDLDRLYTEHQNWRNGLLIPQQAATAQPTFDDVLRIHRRMQAAGLVPPTGGAH